MKFFFVFGKSLPLFPEWLRARSFFQCRAQSFFQCRAQSFLPCTELSVVHRAFYCAQSFFLCTELRFGIEKAISCANALCQNSRIRRSRILGIVCRFFACTELFPVPCTGTELFPVHRAFSCAQSFFLCAELSAVHRAFRCAQSFVLAAFATLVCLRNCVFLCKGTKLQKAVLFAIVRRSFMEESCFCFWKSKANSTFCKVVKQKGEGKPTFSTRSFPLSLRPSPLPCGDRGNPPDPLCNHPKLCSFASAPKNAVHFLYGAVLHRPAFWLPLQPWFVKKTAFFSAKAKSSRILQSRILGIVCPFPPCRASFANETGNLLPNSAQAEFGGFW